MIRVANTACVKLIKTQINLSSTMSNYVVQHAPAEEVFFVDLQDKGDRGLFDAQKVTGVCLTPKR